MKCWTRLRLQEHITLLVTGRTSAIRENIHKTVTKIACNSCVKRQTICYVIQRICLKNVTGVLGVWNRHCISHTFLFLRFPCSMKRHKMCLMWPKWTKMLHKYRTQSDLEYKYFSKRCPTFSSKSCTAEMVYRYWNIFLKFVCCIIKCLALGPLHIFP